MKKLFSLILVLGLLFGGVANSKIIELKKCSIGERKFNPDHYEKRSWIINTQKSLVQYIRVLTDRYYEEQKKEYVKRFGGNAKDLDKISFTNYKIEYADKDFVKAIDTIVVNGEQIETTVEIDIKNKKVFYKFINSTVHKCE